MRERIYKICYKVISNSLMANELANKIVEDLGIKAASSSAAITDNIPDDEVIERCKTSCASFLIKQDVFKITKREEDKQIIDVEIYVITKP